MAGFDNGVSPPGGASYMAPLLSFSALGEIGDSYNQGNLSRQQQEQNKQIQQLNQQKIQQGQQQQELAKTFQGGLPIDPVTKQVDYAKAAQMLAQRGDVGGAMTMLQQAPAPMSPMFGGGQPQGQPQPSGQPTSVPAKPLPAPAANSPQGDPGTGTIVDLVTARLPRENQTTGVTIGKIAETMGIDPNAVLTPGQTRRAQGLLQKYAAGDSGASSGDGGSLPPSANAVQPAPKAGAADSGRLPVSQPQPQGQSPGAPAGPGPQPQPAPIGAGAAPAAPQGAPMPPQGQPPQPPQQAQQPQGGPITPQVPLPKGFNDPQAAILALRQEAARLGANPRAKGQVEALNNWAERIEASIKPVETRPGETMRDPRTGQVIFREPSAAQSRQAAPEVIDKIAEGISSGKQPPSLSGLYSNSGPVRAALQDRGFDLSKAQLEYDRAKKQIASLNGPQMTRFVGLATSVDKTIDEVRELSERMENSGIPLLNKGKLTRYMQLEGNSENGQLAARYIGAVNTLKEEFANLAQGGYAPTEAVWKLANDQVNGDYGVKQMGASLDEIQRLIRYRVHAIPGLDTMGPGAANRYTGQGGAQQGEPAASSAAKPASSTEWVRGPDGKLGPSK